MRADTAIRARIHRLRTVRRNYLRYQRDRVAERDHHGAWDAAVNLSETESEIAGLRFALKALAGEATAPKGGVTTAELADLRRDYDAFVVERQRADGKPAIRRRFQGRKGRSRP